MEATLNGLAIEYEDGGQGPAVVVIHDHPCGGELSGHFFPLIQAGYRVILCNLGGLDDREGDRAGIAVALLNYLGIGRAVIVGVSRGGEVLLELMETHPGRVAAGSLVVSEAAAVAMRRNAGELGMEGALDSRQLAGFRKACFSGTSSPPADLRILPAWVERIRSRLGGKRNLQSLLAAMDLPPLLVASPSAPVPTRARGAIRTLNGHLGRFFDALIPRDETADEEPLSDQF